jgi:hypothetical protein
MRGAGRSGPPWATGSRRWPLTSFSCRRSSAPRCPAPEWLIYADAYRRLDQRADLFADVSARLPGHQAFFAPAARGPLVNEDGCVLYLRAWAWRMGGARDLAVSEYTTRFVHGRYRPDGWGPEPVPRTMQTDASGTVRGSAQDWSQLSFTVCATPAARVTRPPACSRPKQWHRRSRTFAGPDEPLVLGGRFQPAARQRDVRTRLEALGFGTW